MLLIVSNGHDETVNQTCGALDQHEIPYARLDTDQYPEHIALSVDSDRAVLELGGVPVDLADVRCVWWRRPTPPEPTGDDSAIARWAATEAHAALDAALRTIPRELFVNHPDANRTAERKLLVLQAAAATGLAVPPWLLTNRSVDARAFLDRVGQTVAKPLVAGYVDHTRTFWTTRISRDDLDGVGPEPYLLQKLIQRAYDVRITAFGADHVAVRIDVTDPAANIDWRRADPNQTTYSVCELPPGERTCLKTLMRQYGLRFTTADFVVDTAGTWWFLEINPNGQWAWLEPGAGVDLVNRMTALLTA